MVSINRVLCPIDFSEGSTHALEQAAAIASWYKARLIALHVYGPLVPVPGLPVDRALDSELQRSRKETTLFVESVLGSGTAVDVFVDVGHPVRAILERADQSAGRSDCDGYHGSSGFERLFLGSVTEKILRKATCPVLTVPPRAYVTSRLPFARVQCAVDFSEWRSPP